MKSILIAISAPDARRRFSDILSNSGHHVIGAHSGESAIELAATVSPDLALISIVMPQLDGLQTAARIRALSDSRSIPIILLGTVLPLGINEEPLASLVNDYLSLDASSDELLACVARHAGRMHV